MERTPSFGDWVRRRRKTLDLTQVELARQVGCAVATIKKIEGDERRPSRQIAQRLADQLDLPPDQHAAFIHAARAELGADRLAPPPPVAVRNASVSSAARPSNLPSPPTALIGREQDVATVRAQLAGARLLTMTGPGGIGKTRLAQQVAAELIDVFPDGVYFVDLAPLRAPALVSSAMAQTLGIKETGGQSLVTQLKQFLGDKRLLLLLDNFEHLLDAAPLLAELLATASRLKLLVTSRERLHLRGEQEVVVPPLALPSPTVLPPLDQLAQYAAIALFRARGVDARSDFQITQANAAAVAEICACLEGMPLAIELAAARLKLFAPEALLARLSSRLALLTGGARDLPVRQQTIRNTIAWSYGLLSSAEQTLFRRLGIFVGGCTLEAINAVCAAVDDRQQDLIEEVTALVDKSLLRQVEQSDGAARFVLLETLREYALEQLEASGEAERLRQLHAHYYCTLGAVVWPEPGPWHPAKIAVLDRDYDNLWAALTWSQTSAGDPELALRLTGAIRILWYRRGIRRDAIASLERALNHPRGVGRTLAHAIARFELGQMFHFTGEYAAARTQYEQSLALAHEVGDRWWYAIATAYRGGLAAQQGDSATAWARLTESLALFRTLGYAGSIADALHMLAQVAIVDEDPARAEALLAESPAIKQWEHADPHQIGWTLNSLGHAAQLRGAYDRAAQLHQESLVYFQAFGDQYLGLPWAYHSLGETALGLGNLGEATRWLTQGLALSQTLGDQANISWCLAGLGSAAALDEAPERAARLWGAAERLRQAIGCRSAPAARATYERALAVVRAQLDEDAFAAAWAEGRALTVEQAVAYALGESDVSELAANM